ncbi:MAG: ATP-binding protein [Deferrisomatales bacterium]|nr:ATP-binding protein [Deferrisomatales bacterium]
MRNTEQRLRRLLDMLPHGVQENDCSGAITYSNRAHHRMLGYGEGELHGKKIWDVLPSPAERDSLRDHLARLVEEQPPPAPYLATNRREDGSLIELQIDWDYERDTAGILRGFISVITDVTGRKRAEEDLRHRTHGLTALLEVSKRLAETLDTNRVLQAAVDGVTELIGLDTAAVYLLDGEELYLRATTPPLAPGFPDALRVASLADHPHIARVMASGEPLLEADFATANLTPAERFVVEQRNLGTALYVPLVVDAHAIGAFIVGSVQKPSHIPDWGVDLARTLANLSALAVRNAQLYDDGQKYASQLQQALADRIEAEEERKELNAQLAQAQKMESIGRLAGGVAHDFNNMLSVILGHADLALHGLDAKHPLHRHLTQISNAAQRSSELTRQLLAFARKQTIAPKVIDLNAVVGTMLNMLHRLIGEDIDLSWWPGEGIGLVKVDPAQVDQILANLCVNARDAIAGSGKITIETSDATLDEAYCSVHPECLPGAYVVVAVSDDGSGMNEETLTHAFEPFFSTKEAGRGTGLGLATVYGIVKQNGGFIHVYSEPGRGTTFRIYLCRYDTEGEAERFDDRPPVAVGGDETILLVEDEEMILKLGVEMLESLGYRVLAARDPLDALRLAQENAGRIDLLVTDVVMPGMNGRELAERLKPGFPELRTLYISGYTANVIAHHGILQEGVDLLAKPFSKDDLAARVREALAAEGPG